MSRLWKLSVVCFALLAAACAEPRLGKNLVIVLPDEDGKVGQVTVSDGKNEVVLNKALSAAKITSGGAVEAVAVNDTDVNQLFAATLDARPIPPRRFRLYFIEGTDTLTAASEGPFNLVFEDIKRRQNYEVEVTGHTDTVDTKERNSRLSIQRALKIRDRLVEKGIKQEFIVVYGRGEWDLFIPTADNVPEPKNRRVEILVR